MDLRTIATATEMAKALDADPIRMLEVARHHKAILGALNGSHRNGEQDAMCVFEAVAMVVAQLTAALPPNNRAGILSYISARAENLSHEFRDAGKAAAFKIDA